MIHIDILTKLSNLCLKVTTCGEFSAVVVEVEGHAYYSGVASFTLENEDTLKNGFLLR